MADETQVVPDQTEKIRSKFRLVIERDGKVIREVLGVTQFMVALYDGKDYQTFSAVAAPEVVSYMTDLLKMERCYMPIASSAISTAKKHTIAAPKQGLFLPPGAR